MDHKKLPEEHGAPKNRAQEDISKNKHRKELKHNLKKYSEFCEDIGNEDHDMETFERIKKRF